jgi:hypothetical protein
MSLARFSRGEPSIALARTALAPSRAVPLTVGPRRERSVARAGFVAPRSTLALGPRGGPLVAPTRTSPLAAAFVLAPARLDPPAPGAEELASRTAAPDARARARRDLAQLRDLFVRQLAPQPALERTEPQRPVRGTMEAGHVEPDGLAHPAHLPVAALVDRDLDQPALALGVADDAGLELDAALQPGDLPRARPAREPHTIRLVDPVARVHEVVRQLAVVREQQQPAGVGVEAPDREHAPAGRQELRDRAAALGVVERRDDADRLVQGEVAVLGGAG